MVPWFVRGWEMRSELKCNKLRFTLVMSPYFTLFIGGVPPPSPFLLSSRPRVRVARVCYSVRGSRSSLRRASTVHFGFVDKLSLWSCVTKTEIKNNTTNKLLLKQLCFHSCLCSLSGLLYNGFKFVSCVTFPFQG